MNPIEIKFDIKSGDIVDLVKEIARWVQNALERYDESKRAKVRAAIPDVIKSMTLLAADKRAFANMYEESKKSETEGAAYQKQLKKCFEEIKKRITELLVRLNQADSAWVTDNIRLVEMTRSVVNEKQTLIFRTENELEQDVPGKFRNEADRLTQVAEELAAALARVQAETR
jgi:hypothetical protein